MITANTLVHVAWFDRSIEHRSTTYFIAFALVAMTLMRAMTASRGRSSRTSSSRRASVTIGLLAVAALAAVVFRLRNSEPAGDPASDVTAPERLTVAPVLEERKPRVRAVTSTRNGREALEAFNRFSRELFQSARLTEISETDLRRHRELRESAKQASER